MEAYHFHIESAEIYISAGVVPAWDGAGAPPKVYDETFHLELSGKVLSPLVVEGRPVCLSIYGSHEVQAELAKLRENRTKSGGVGFVDFWGKNHTACVWLSVRAASSIYDLVRSNELVDIVLLGEKLKRRRAAIHHFHAGTKFERDDWY